MIPGVDYTPDRLDALDAVETWLAAIRTGATPSPEVPAVFILTGLPGTGKSHLAARVVEHLTPAPGFCGKCSEGIVATRDASGRLTATICSCVRRFRPEFVSILTPLGSAARPGLFDLFADEAGFDHSRRADARAELNRLADARLTIVDEFGGEREGGTTFLPGLLRFLDARARRFTWFISNLTDKEIAARYEPRIVSRLLGASVSRVVPFVGVDRRNESPEVAP